MNRSPVLLLPLALALAACDTGTTATPSDMAMQPQPNVDFGPEKLDGGPNTQPTTAVVTSSSLMTSGSINTIALADKAPKKALDTTIDQDNLVRAAAGRVYVVDRTHGTIRIYDPATWKNPVEIVTGDMTAPHEMSNPHDVLPVPASSKLYVALYNNDADHAVGVLDAAQPMKGVVKWIAVPKAGTPLVRANNLYFCGPYVYVVLEDLDENFAVTGNGRIAVIDPATDKLDASGTNVITLAGKNPGGGAADGITRANPMGGSCDLVLVADSGDYTKPIPNGGGVEQVDLTRRKSNGFLVTDADLKGAPGTVTSASATLAYVILNNPDFTNNVVAINPQDKKVIGSVLGPAGFVGFAVVSPDGQLFAGVTRGDTKKGQPAAAVYIGAADGKMLPAMGIDLGQAPYAIAFY